ncbi:hypothetical protein ACT26D_06430 [Megasphaera elsdenii]|uniref:hypothetical protein n=1 Tax=Megasphaera elsdenii TaxID=907 RepID=UPI004036CFD5
MEKVWFLNGSYDWVCGEVLGLYGTEASCRKHFEDILSDWWPEGENDTDSRGRTRKECIKAMAYEDWSGNVYLSGNCGEVQD